MGLYYVVSAFPPLVLGQKPQLSYEQIRDMIKLNVTKHQWEQIEILQRIVDLRNIRALWLGEPLDVKGNFDETALEEALLVRQFLPSFVYDFLERYESIQDRLHYFASLYASLYAETMPQLSGFLLKYYQFERQVRLALTALRAKEEERDLSYELQFEDSADPFVMQLLAQKEEKEVILPQEVEDLKPIFEENKSEPWRLHLAILQFRLEKIENMENERPFSMDQVLGYLARLAICEEAALLNKELGLTMLAEVCKA